jgi:spore coat protein U-like protein
MTVNRSLLIAIVSAASVLLQHLPAHAQLLCSATVSNATFTIASSATTSTTTATVTYTCSGGGNSDNNVRGCLALGPGSGGAAANNSPRFMVRSTGGTLNHNLRTSANGAIWSAAVSTPIPLAANGSGTAQATIFADVPAGQRSAPAGIYSSAFAGPANVQFSYGPGGSCNNTGTSPSFTVSANILPSCTLSVAPLAFGSVGSLTSNKDAETSITANCTSGVPYSISLGRGAGITSPTARKMTKGTDTLTYGTYQDPNRVVEWGDLISNDVDGTGTGTAQSIPVYGRIPPQPLPPSGTYNDTVVVTITY